MRLMEKCQHYPNPVAVSIASEKPLRSRDGSLPAHTRFPIPIPSQIILSSLPKMPLLPINRLFIINSLIPVSLCPRMPLEESGLFSRGRAIFGIISLEDNLRERGKKKKGKKKMVALVSRQGRQLQRYSNSGRRLVVGFVPELPL